MNFGLLLDVLRVFYLITSCHGFVNQRTARPTTTTAHPTIAPLSMSLKPAAVPLMDAGKALARSGELLIDATSSLDIYGGGLSAAGAQIRNAGDCVAQAAASCRFKTAAELVIDELREAATCLDEATGKMKLAVEEARSDDNEVLAGRIESTVQPIGDSHVYLEASGAGIQQRIPLTEVGGNLVRCGDSLGLLASAIKEISPEVEEASLSSQRMTYCAERMRDAGNSLAGTKQEESKGKVWLKM